MKQIIAIILFFSAINAQSSPFNSYDVVLYSEYYFDGLMAEVDGEVKNEFLPLNFEMRVPANADSVFFVSGSASSEAEVKNLTVLNSKDRSFVKISILESKFRIFIFYSLNRDGPKRTGDFDFELNHSIDDGHIIIQVPLVAEGFTFSEKDSETFKDQHGINFHRVHIHDFKANSTKSVSFSYNNPSGDISINKLQMMLSSDDKTVAPLAPPSPTQAPIRHKLPLWEPLALLGVVSVTVGWMFSLQRKKEIIKKSNSVSIDKNSKFCTNCGQGLLPEHKFCSKCGGQC